MKSILIVVLALFSVNALSSTKAFDMKMELSLDGHHVSSPKVIALPNETARISEGAILKREETFIEVTASDFSSKDIRDGILMKFKIGYERHGKRYVTAVPEIIAKAGQEASIEEGHMGKKGSLRLKVVANRIQK